MRLLLHALHQITGNLPDAVRIAVPLLILGLLQTVLDAAGMLGEATLGLGLTGVYVIFSIGVAIHWHRFVLKNERPQSAVASPQGKYMWPYLGRSLLLGLVAVMVAAAVVGVGLSAGPMVNMPIGAVTEDTFVPGPGMVPLLLIASILVTWVVTRLSLGLPAIAVDKRIGFAQSWGMTAPMNREILFCVTVLGAANFGEGVLVAYMQVHPLTAFVGNLFDAVFYVLILMLSLSVLTTLYGHLVEKRDLVV